MKKSFDFESLQTKEKPENWTPVTLVGWLSQYLKEHGITNSNRLDAEELVSMAMGISRLDIYLEYDKPCTNKELSILKGFIQRRIRREPMAYITGYCEFWTQKLDVGPGVLVPRPDTETLIEKSLDYIPKNLDQPFNIIELGTGSAAIPLAICSERNNINFLTVEKSSEAIKYAQKNISQYEEENLKKSNHINLIQGNLFNSIKSAENFDLVISNPPYIPAADIEKLEDEVRNWEPREALDGGEDGLSFYNYLMKAAEFILKPNGYLILEHGFDQAEIMKNLFEGNKNFTLIDSIKDFGGNDRATIIKKSSLEN